MRVLIVDDHTQFRTVARELLERRGFAVVGEAGGAMAALEAVVSATPDAVLLDLHLPDGYGIDVCRALTRTYPALAVLLVSADGPPETLDGCGARGFVPKAKLGSVDLAALFGAA